MNRPAGFILLFSLLAASSSGCDRSIPTLNGYAEGEFVFVSAPVSGILSKRVVNRGAEVSPDDVLFSLDPEPELAAEMEAKKRLEEAKSHLADLQKGKRPSEIAALEAQIEEARANLTYTTTELERQRDLIKKHTSSKRDYDQALVGNQRAKATLDNLLAQLTTAKLGAREDEIAAAQSSVAGQEEAVAQASWRVAQKTQRAPKGALVADTFYEEGEWVAAGEPVVSLLPPENLKIRFFIPEGHLSDVKVGQNLVVLADNLAETVSATVSYISPQAEFTPPVIFSRESRAKLVFMVEATPSQTTTEGVLTALKPGQPVQIDLE